MAEHPNAQLVRKGYDAFTRGDMDTLRGLMAADATHHVPGTGILSGDFKGQDAILDMYRRLGEETEGTFRVELRQVLVDGRGHAVTLHRFTADRRGLSTWTRTEALSSGSSGTRSPTSTNASRTSTW